MHSQNRENFAACNIAALSMLRINTLMCPPTPEHTSYINHPAHRASVPRPYWRTGAPFTAAQTAITQRDFSTNLA